MALVGAAAAVVLPANAMRDILIHKGNPAPGFAASTLFNDPLKFAVLYGGGDCTEAMRWQMNFYQHASRVTFYAPRQQSKTYFIQLGNACHEELEKRMFAMLKKKDQEMLKALSDFEDAESWRRILPKQKRA